MRTVHLALVGALAFTALALAQGRGGGGGARPAPAPVPTTPTPPPPARERPQLPVAPMPESPTDLAGLYFRTCDYDGNGWISFNESNSSMNLDRDTYAVYDTDRDGRITLEEYTARYLTVISRGGAFAPPKARVISTRIPKRTPEELITAFDTNNDGALDRREVQTALAEYGAQGVDAQVVLETIDRDRSERIEASEAQALLDVLAPPTITTERKRYASIAELFDQVEARKLAADTTPQPPRILGPVSTFRRLDFDQSGKISVSDLDELQRPLLIPIRKSAVISTLDLDGDGELSPREFHAAMR
ncbi:MAG: EF-hand domain-containing protein [Planctomycetes bacterium]|nr:EF-hand domain-containing protein [Planctomycetota bacterium]